MSERRPPADELVARHVRIERPTRERFDQTYAELVVHVTAIDITPLAAKSALEVARAQHVEPIRVVMTGYLIAIITIAVLAVTLAVTSAALQLDWRVALGAFVVLACLIVPSRTLLAKLVEQMFKAKGATGEE